MADYVTSHSAHEALIKTATQVLKDINSKGKPAAVLNEDRGSHENDEGEKVDEKNKHIILQLRNAHDLSGDKHIEFKNGTKAKLNKEQIKKVLSVYDAMKRSDQKESFANDIHTSPENLLKHA